MPSFPLPPSSDTPADPSLLPNAPISTPVEPPLASPPPLTQPEPIISPDSFQPTSTPQPIYEAPPAYVETGIAPPVFTPSPPQSPPTPTPATVPVKSSPFKWLSIALGAAAILGLLVFVIIRFVIPLFAPKDTTLKITTIVYQGLWETPEVMRPLLDEFEKQNPTIKVDYQIQSQVDYRERLQTTLSQASTPDVVRLHSTWLPMVVSSLQSAPADVLTPADIQANFDQVVSDSVVVGSQVYGVPLTFDGLSLFVNQTMLDTLQLQAPKTWEDLHSAAKALTQKDPTTGSITKAGVALGSTANVDHWPEIVSLMSLQAGGNLRAPDSRVGEALNYYSLFANPSTDYYSWNNTLPTSTQAFAAGKVAMILAPSWRSLEIKALNPSLAWKIYPVPQLPETPVVTWANFWMEAVPKNTTHPEEAWKLIKFLSTSQAQQLLYDAATTQRGYAQAPANKSLSATLANNPIIGPYLQQAPTSKTFFTVSFTHDGETGINSRLNKYLEDAINSLNQGRDTTTVLPTVQQGFQQVLSQYGIVPPVAPVAP